MKNKKGFTLVELLAVVAILSLLVIIALPNVMSMFNNAKKNAFATELKEIYKTAEQKWISDSVSSTAKIYYARVEGTTDGSCSSCQQLKLSGRSELHYMISFNKGGKVTSFYATDGTYQYAYTGDNLKIEDIVGEDVVQVSGLPESTSDDPAIDNTVLTITCNADSQVDTSIGVVGGPARLVATYMDGTTELGKATYYEGGVTQSFKTASDYSLSKSGYQFQGWGLTSTTKTFDAGATVTEAIINQYSGNKTLYAVWKDVVTPSCNIHADGSTAILSYNNNTNQYGMVSGNGSTPTYNSKKSMSMSSSGGTFTGYVKGPTGIQKGCRTTFTPVQYRCNNSGFSLSGTTCKASATPRFTRQIFRCTQTGSNSYSYQQVGSQTVYGSCSPTSPGSCSPSAPNVGHTYYKCQQSGYACQNGGSLSGNMCTMPATPYCNNGSRMGNYCYQMSTF